MIFKKPNLIKKNHEHEGNEKNEGEIRDET